jgi:hypothetical protein
MASKRSAWLVLDDRIMPLDDYAAGYAMTELDIGYPDVRDVTNNRPAQHGIDDQTRYFGGRVVTAKITAWPGATVPLDDIIDAFGPYMNPGARPELHYRTLSSKDIERVIVLRASAFAAPMPSPGLRQFQLSWVAPDPVIRDAALKSGRAWSGSSSPPGRAYNLAYARIYPPGSGAPSVAVLYTDGDIAVPPFLRVYGPITGPYIEIVSQTDSGDDITGGIRFESSLTVDPGQWLDIDVRNHTARIDGDPAQSVVNRLDFGATTWPFLQSSPYVNYLSLSGSSTSGITQVEAYWQDLYLI